jgi:GH25 family lysozyme M1 (1,4-beta-N-acetylmuramidase)
MPTLNGIDVYWGQDGITGPLPQWSLVHSAGLSFVMAKASQGNYRTDPEFKANWTAMRSYNDWCRIAYHFLAHDVDPGVQARYFRNVVGDAFGARDGVMVDIEVVPPRPGVREVKPVSANFAVEAIQAIEEAFDRRGVCIVYIGQFYKDNVDQDPRVAQRPWHLPWYTKHGERPSWTRTPAIWQYSSTQHVPGIAGNVDANEVISPLVLLSACRWPTTGSGTTPPSKPSEVPPVFDPPQQLAPIVDQQTPPSGQGVWLLGQDGGVYTYGGAPFYGAPAGMSYWGGRRAARFDKLNDAEKTAGKKYVVLSTAGERYAFPGS